ncbi:MAG: sensor signal transduction histidine kinase [Thermoleophilia bacterium]|nr:sensor signal transduction histidine kinase [Thermoleophilia bacterium]MCZ4496439.1 sensor signal transduction histidine kinase [Thermoleophilia bacterium]
MSGSSSHRLLKALAFAACAAAAEMASAAWLRRRALGEGERAEAAALRLTAQQLNTANASLRLHDEMRTHFLAMASHELRTPLTSISGFASTLVDRWEDLSDDQRRQFVQIIHEQGARLTRLVNDLLALTRLEGGEYPVRVRPIQVRERLEQARKAAGLDEEAEITCEADVMAVADPDALEQILLNFLTNAKRYGAPPIRLDAFARDDGWVEISVYDTGPGVPRPFIPHLFAKFAQGPTGTPDPTGTGLGLSIVQGLATAQGGDSWYEPVFPHGSRFAIRLETPKERVQLGDAELQEPGVSSAIVVEAFPESGGRSAPETSKPTASKPAATVKERNTPT